MAPSLSTITVGSGAALSSCVANALEMLIASPCLGFCCADVEQKNVSFCRNLQLNILQIAKNTLKGWRSNGDKHSRAARYLARKLLMSSLLTEGMLKI
jgi:hypothetical protein